MRTTRLVGCSLLALALAWAPYTARATTLAGVAAAVRGEVTLARAGQASRAVVGGEDILMQDALRSGPSSGMQILLLDETAFTLGPESELVVDEFVYDPASGAGRVSASVVKGVFRFITGKIAKKNPSDMSVSLPAGTIGVRGTIVVGRCDDATRSSLVVLLGDTRPGAPTGGASSIEVCNAGTCERVATPGFGTRIAGPDAAPSPSARIDPGEIDAILRDLGESGAGGGDAGPLDAAGMPLDEADRVQDIRRKLQGLDVIDTLSDKAAQDARTPTAHDLPSPQTPPSGSYNPPIDSPPPPESGGSSRMLDLRTGPSAP